MSKTTPNQQAIIQDKQGYLKLLEDSEGKIKKSLSELWNEIEPDGRNITIWTWEEGMKLFHKMLQEEYKIQNQEKMEELTWLDLAEDINSKKELTNKEIKDLVNKYNNHK